MTCPRRTDSPSRTSADTFVLTVVWFRGESVPVSEINWRMSRRSTVVTSLAENSSAAAARAGGGFFASASVGASQSSRIEPSPEILRPGAGARQGSGADPSVA